MPKEGSQEINNVIIENVEDGGHHSRLASNGAKQKPGSKQKTEWRQKREREKLNAKLVAVLNRVPS